MVANQWTMKIMNMGDNKTIVLFLVVSKVKIEITLLYIMKVQDIVYK
ncbi:hypothetical protein [Bacillus sp. S/N-304-OC-R1]|nr:hypothetical protein [Bacillus sp. S/N-304-OC-R1]MBY0123175.1 hypothetical protein [Bacillus sp. S/N-304-OC-R1]